MTLSPLFLVVVVAGLGSAKHEERDTLLNKPVNCETAAEDIAALEAAMPTGGERLKSAVQTFSPVGRVVGVVRGTREDTKDVLTGRTKEELTARVKEIRVACGLPEPTETSKP
ncbi:MAG TPA: hypothetical protein DCL54_03515 [Alphaproteobacteria bacterium]|nr:hypothetical protein [Alphaproteobacteria bacterium]HAJ45633.1 hypothetical protein [Alphaproteobacteria bacterium]